MSDGSLRGTRTAPRLLRYAIPVLAVLGLAGVAVSTDAPVRSTGHLRTASVARPVQGVTLVCPAVPPQTADLVTRTELATSRPGDGQAVVQALAPPGSPLAEQTIALSTAVTAVTLPPEQPLVITATGPASGGVVATRVTRGDSGPDRGYSVDTCTTPRTDAWFVGAASGSGQNAVLAITDADDAPAEVSVLVLTRDGVLTPISVTGRVVPSHGTITVGVDELAPGQATTAVEVVASRGRVASSMREHRGLDAVRPGGVDSVPQALGAARTVVLPGIPGSVAGTVLDGSRLHRVLTVGVPGVEDATLRVTVTDENGSFVPTGLDAVAVPAGTVRSVDLDGPLTAERATVSVTSAEGVPLVAGVLIDAQARFGDYHETLQIGAGVPLVGPTVFPDARVGTGPHGSTDTFLTLTALGGDAQASASGAATTMSLDIGSGRLAEVKAHVLAPTDGPVTLIPMPGRAAVYAAATIEELGLNGPLIAGAGESGGRADVTLPVVAAIPTLPLVDAAG